MIQWFPVARSQHTDNGCWILTVTQHFSLTPAHTECWHSHSNETIKSTLKVIDTTYVMYPYAQEWHWRRLWLEELSTLYSHCLHAICTFFVPLSASLCLLSGCWALEKLPESTLLLSNPCLQSLSCLFFGVLLCSKGQLAWKRASGITWKPCGWCFWRLIFHY